MLAMLDQTVNVQQIRGELQNKEDRCIVFQEKPMARDAIPSHNNFIGHLSDICARTHTDIHIHTDIHTFTPFFILFC